MNLLIRGPFFLKSNGYASALKAHIDVFSAAFLQTKFENFEKIKLNKIERNAYNDFIVSNLIADNWKPDVVINYLAPNVAKKYDNCFNIIFTYWETNLIPGNAYSSNKVKQKNNWVQELNSYNLVLTASNSAKKAFINSGVTTPIEVLPWPLEIFSPEIRETRAKFLNVINGKKQRLSQIRKDSSFVLSSIGEYQPRKNFQQLIKNFILTFYQDDSKTLILKLSNTGTGLFRENKIIKDIKEYVKWIKIPDKICCNIYVSTDHLLKAEIFNILECSDYYITTSRGEGMGGPVIEALNIGIPIISGWHTSLVDFLNCKNSIQIEHYEDYIQGKYSVHYEPHQKCVYYTDESIQKSMLRALEKRASFQKAGIKSGIHDLLNIERNKALFSNIIKQYLQ